MNAVNGEADFTGKNIKFDKVGDYNLKILLDTNNNIFVVTNNIKITPGVVNKVKFAVAPSLTAKSYAFLETQPILRVYDSQENFINNYNDLMYLTFTTNTKW